MKKKIYKVAVLETYRKVVSVPAKNEKEAHRRVYDAWQNTEFLLDVEDFEDVEVYVLGETDDKNLLRIEAEN